MKKKYHPSEATCFQDQHSGSRKFIISIFTSSSAHFARHRTSGVHGSARRKRLEIRFYLNWHLRGQEETSNKPLTPKVVNLWLKMALLSLLNVSDNHFEQSKINDDVGLKSGERETERSVSLTQTPELRRPWKRQLTSNCSSRAA